MFLYHHPYISLYRTALEPTVDWLSYCSALPVCFPPNIHQVTDCKCQSMDPRQPTISGKERAAQLRLVKMHLNNAHKESWNKVNTSLAVTHNATPDLLMWTVNDGDSLHLLCSHRIRAHRELLCTPKESRVSCEALRQLKRSGIYGGAAYHEDCLTRDSCDGWLLGSVGHCVPAQHRLRCMLQNTVGWFLFLMHQILFLLYPIVQVLIHSLICCWLFFVFTVFIYVLMHMCINTQILCCCATCRVYSSLQCCFAYRLYKHIIRILLLYYYKF